MARFGNVSSQQLEQFILRIERLEEEKKNISADISEVYAEAKSFGYDTKIMRSLIKIRKMDQHEREEYEALMDIYKAALGMLNDTPLGEAAIRKLSGQKKPDDEDAEPEGGEAIESTPEENFEASDDDQKEKGEPEAPQPTVAEAREMGKKAAEDGLPVSDNPFPARDPRRAAWDEAWCQASGSDGMELPDAWRRSSKPKKGGDE